MLDSSCPRIAPIDNGNSFFHQIAILNPVLGRLHSHPMIEYDTHIYTRSALYVPGEEFNTKDHSISIFQLHVQVQRIVRRMSRISIPVATSPVRKHDLSGVLPAIRESDSPTPESPINR